MNCPYIDSRYRNPLQEEPETACISLCQPDVFCNDNYCMKCPFFKLSRHRRRKVLKRMRIHTMRVQ